MTRRINIAIVLLMVLIGLPYYWLLVDNRPGDAAAKPVTIEQLRALAGAIPGAAPSAVEYESVAFRRVPGNIFVAGAGLKRQLIGVMAFRLPVDGAAPVMIDSGVTKAASDEMGMEAFDPQARTRIDQALRGAGLVLLTHEHIDHEGGLIGLNDASLLSKVRFTQGQLPGNSLTDMMIWPAGTKPVVGVKSGGPQAIAPGVVAIPAPSHTPGSQMIYVRLASGREILFAGDIATMAQSWQETRARSRLVGDYFAKEDRPEVYAWLLTIKALKAAAPRLEVIAGHDLEYIEHHETRRGFKKGFSL